MSTVFTPTKTVQTDLLSWQDVAAGAYNEGASLNVATKLGGLVTVKVGRQTGTAFTAGSPNIRIQVSPKSSGDDQWTDAWVFQPQVGVSIANTTANGAISAGASTFAVASATNIAAGDLLFLGHTTDPTKYELVRVKSISGTTVTPVHNVVNAHDTGAEISDQSEEGSQFVGFDGALRARAVADNISSGQGIYVEVGITTLDNITGT